MEYMIKILADLLKPTKMKLPAFGYTQLQPVYVKNLKELTPEKYQLVSRYRQNGC